MTHQETLVALAMTASRDFRDAPVEDTVTDAELAQAVRTALLTQKADMDAKLTALPIQLRGLSLDRAQRVLFGPGSWLCVPVGTDRVAVVGFRRATDHLGSRVLGLVILSWHIRPR